MAYSSKGFFKPCQVQKVFFSDLKHDDHHFDEMEILTRYQTGKKEQNNKMHGGVLHENKIRMK